MLIAVLNESKSCTNAEVDLMCQAINKQMILNVAPAFNRLPVPIRFFDQISKVPNWAWVIHVAETESDIPEGVLGFHQEETTTGRVDGYICCSPILSNGGSVLSFSATNPGAYTVSATLSHECLESFFDPYTNLYFDAGRVSFAGEICDPCETIGYGVEINGTIVSVSDFCFPSFFNPLAKEPINGPFNYLKTIKNPFEILPNGYAVVREGGPGTEKQVFGETFPEWKKAQKKKAFTRSHRLVRQSPTK
jgi:hypothetical protein